MRFRFPTAMALAAASALLATSCVAHTVESADAGGAPDDDAKRVATEAGNPLVERSRLTIPATELNGIRIEELSGLAWDQDEQLLYAVSDQGNVFHFRLRMRGGGIVAAEPVLASALSDPSEAEPSARRFNAEGLTLQNADNRRAGDTVLVVSLEGAGPPSIVGFDPRGSMRGELPVPAPANDPANYRKKRQGLEAVAYHPAHGLMTAPESPLSAQPENRHAVYASGRSWSFIRYSPDSRLKAVDSLGDHRLLVLERSKLDLSRTITASLRSIDLATCRDGTLCDVVEMAVLPPGPDNFEGMTLFGKGGVLIVSDHGGNGDLQSTTLILLVPR